MAKETNPEFRAEAVRLALTSGFKLSMSGTGSHYCNAAVETFFNRIKAELLWCDPGEIAGTLRSLSSDTSTGSTIRNAGIQLSAGKALWPSKHKLHE